VRLERGAPLWEPRSLQNFWHVGDVSAPLNEDTDISVIVALVRLGRLAVVEGSIEDEAPTIEQSPPSESVDLPPRQIKEESPQEQPKPKRTKKTKK